MNAATALRCLSQRTLVRLALAAAAAAAILVIPTATAGPSVSISITTPGAGATISGSTYWSATVGNGKAKTVDFYVDGVKRWTEQSAPYEYNVETHDGRLDTRRLSNGVHELAVVANAANGSTATSRITVVVANAPVAVAIASPAAGATISGATYWNATVSNGVATTVDFYIDGVKRWTEQNAPYEYNVDTHDGRIDTRKLADGAHELKVVANTAAGPVASPVVKVTVANGTSTTTATNSTTTTTVKTATTSGTFGAALPARLGESRGGQYFVDGTRGSDANPGTSTAPWRTINKALAAVPLSGSVINVRAGTYVGMHQFVKRYADPANPVTLQAMPGEHVVLTTPANAQLHAFKVADAGGLRIRGFEITAPTALDGIKVENGKDVEIEGNVIHATGRQGVTVAGSGTTAPTFSKNVQVWNNRFYDNGSSNQFDHSIYWGAVGSNSDGIDHSAYGGVIANNVFHDQPNGFQLQVGSQASGLIVTNNTFYRAAGAYPVGTAIGLYTESQTAAYVTRNVTIVNNLITHASYKGVYGSGGGGLMSTNVVRNNMAYGNGGGDFLSYYGSTSRVLFTLEANFSGKSPLFVNPGNRDFRLQAGSPAIDKADPAYAPAIDAAGKARRGAADLGAFEH